MMRLPQVNAHGVVKTSADLEERYRPRFVVVRMLRIIDSAA
jgi:hypothetical protein